jgi:hypothetical protein
MEGIRPGLELHRNLDKAFHDRLHNSKTMRKIAVEMRLSTHPARIRLEIKDEDGNVGSVKKNAYPCS